MAHTRKECEASNTARASAIMLRRACPAQLRRQMGDAIGSLEWSSPWRPTARHLSEMSKVKSNLVDRSPLLRATLLVIDTRVKSKEDNTHTRDRARCSPTHTQERSTSGDSWEG